MDNNNPRYWISIPAFRGRLRDSPSLNCTIYLTMDQFKKYEFTIKVKTNHDPRQAIFEIVDTLKGILPVLSIEHRLVEDRPTNDEHHGGIVDDDNT